MPATQSAEDIARIAVEAAEAKLGKDIVVLDVSERLGIADIFVIISAANERQVGAIVDEILKREWQAGQRPVFQEGVRDEPWVLIDYFETVVHVQQADARETYSLDRLWKDCPPVTW